MAREKSSPVFFENWHEFFLIIPNNYERVWQMTLDTVLLHLKWRDLFDFTHCFQTAHVKLYILEMLFFH